MSQLPAPRPRTALTRVRDAFAPAPPEERVANWHVSPGIDSFAYAYSWLLLLIPFWFMGPNHPDDYLWYWILGNTFSYSHRHLTLPYVYFDSQVFRTQVARFLVIPSLLFGGFLASGLFRSVRIPAGAVTSTDALVLAAGVALYLQWRRMDRTGTGLSRPLLVAMVALPLAVIAFLLGVPMGTDGHAAHSLAVGGAIAVLSLWMGREGRATTPFVRGLAPLLVAALVVAASIAANQGPAGLGPASRMRMPVLVGGIAAFAGAWNIWHVYMQKYGILRMYAAKSGLPAEERTPGWVDRFLVFGWLPAYLMFLPTAARPLLEQHAPTVLPWLSPILDGLDRLAYVGLPLTLGLGVSSVVLYTWHEWRAAHRVPGRVRWNPARLVMGSGTVLLALTFFFFNPFEAYVAYGFSHAVEYVVFVWAFQRRRYRGELAHRPLLGRFLARPLIYYLAFFALIGGTYAVLEYGPGRLYDSRPTVFGTPVRSWIFYWTIWQSMAHFYFDSFLWKMRLPEVRASL